MNLQRPFTDFATGELHLELALRSGPRYQCQASECRSMEDSPAPFDTCPACGRKGFLGGGFERNTESAQWKAWEERTIAGYRDKEAVSA